MKLLTLQFTAASVPRYWPDSVVACGYCLTWTCSEWVLDNTMTTELNWSETNILLGHIFRGLDHNTWIEVYMTVGSLTNRRTGFVMQIEVLFSQILNKKEQQIWQVTWYCRAHFHSGKSEAVCCLSWPRESWLLFHLRRTGQVSKWSPTLKGPGPESHLDTPYTPVEGHSTAVVETRWAGSPDTWK